jgi:hypothetical protein
VNATLPAQVEAFFISYNKQRGQHFKVTCTGGLKRPRPRQVKLGAVSLSLRQRRASWEYSLMLRSSLLQLIKAVWRTPVTLFWPIWIGVAIGSAICVAWVVGQAAGSRVQKTKKALIARTPRYVWSRGAVVALTLLGLFLVCYIVLTLTWEDFAYNDNEMFTLYMLKGHNFAPPIWQQNGRFFPLGHQEFNLIRHFTGTVAGYHVLPIIQLLAVCGILLVLDDKLSIVGRAGLTALALVTPGVVISFGGLIFDERNVVFWLVCLVLCIKRFGQTWSTAWAVGAAVSAQIMIYYKEPAFLLLVGLAVGGLGGHCWNGEQSGWDRSRLRDKESRLYLCLLSLAVLFFLYYAAVMLPHPNMQYANERHRPVGEVVLAYLKLDQLAWLFVAVVLSRIYLILRHRVPPLPLWDGLALGGVAYFTAYLYLGMFSSHYLGPVDLVAVLYVGRFVILSREQRSVGSKVAIMVLLGAVLFQDVALSAFRVFERKNIIHGKAEIAGVVKARYQSGEGVRQRIFFPFASPYCVMEFASYLNYRGVPVEGPAVESGELNSVVVVSRAVAKDGPCMGYASPVCHFGNAPDSGDLVIVLPDDDASLAEIVPYLDRGKLLFSYAPRPRIPRWLYPFVSSLHIPSSRLGRKELPDRWLHASVTVWK